MLWRGGIEQAHTPGSSSDPNLQQGRRPAASALLLRGTDFAGEFTQISVLRCRELKCAAMFWHCDVCMWVFLTMSIYFFL